MSGILVVGSLNIDLVINTPKLPLMGETILGSGFLTVPGGKGANQAIAAARLGGKVTMVGCVGNDAFGENLVKKLELDGIDHKHVSIARGLSTGIAVIVIKDGDNFIIVDPGANLELSAEKIRNKCRNN